MRKFFSLLLVILFFYPACAKVQVHWYGINKLGDSAVLRQVNHQFIDSTLATLPLMKGRIVIDETARPHKLESRTVDFYLLVFLCLLLGLIKFVDERYFLNLWQAFWNPMQGNRQIKDQLQGAGVPNLLMNLFFVISAGAYLYYVVKLYTPDRSGNVSSSLLIVMLMVGTAMIYLAKYLTVRFIGWAFRMEGVTDYYLFNVFLINKILSVVLIPFVILLAFANAGVAHQMVLFSFILVGALLLNRYVRSWQIFGSFFQYSKFHFFMYLCASELLPLAVLMKLLVKGLMFY